MKAQLFDLLDEDWWWELAGPNHLNFFSLPLVEAKLNYLLSFFYHIHSVGQFFNLFRKLDHPDSRWFFGLFPSGIDTREKEALYRAKELLVSQPFDGGRSLFYASICCSFDIPEVMSLLRKSIDMGYVRSYDMLYVGYIFNLTEEMLKKATKHGSVSCWKLLGDRLKQRVYVYDEKGARLGDNNCFGSYSHCLFETDKRLYWLLNFVTSCKDNDWFSWFSNAGSASKPAELFLIGELTTRAESNPSLHIIKPFLGFEQLILTKERIDGYHKAVLAAVRSECLWWVIVARNLQVNKDVRKLIAKKLWASRFEGREF